MLKLWTLAHQTPELMFLCVQVIVEPGSVQTLCLIINASSLQQDCPQNILPDFTISVR